MPNCPGLSVIPRQPSLKVRKSSLPLTLAGLLTENWLMLASGNPGWSA
jgi:hypothetical protein